MPRPPSPPAGLGVLAAALGLLSLAGCSRDFWDRSPRVAGRVQESPFGPPPTHFGAAPPASPARPAPSLPPPVTAAPPPSTARLPSPSEGPTREDEAVLDLVNRVRVGRALRPLRFDPTLFRAARDHSLEQHLHGFMGHGSPTPGREQLAQRLAGAGYRGRKYAEVVAWGYRDAAAVVEGWMNSPEHRTVLLDPLLADAGFSRIGDSWTGDLAAPYLDDALPPAPRPAPPPAALRGPARPSPAELFPSAPAPPPRPARVPSGGG